MKLVDFLNSLDEGTIISMDANFYYRGTDIKNLDIQDNMISITINGNRVVLTSNTKSVLKHNDVDDQMHCRYIKDMRYGWPPKSPLSGEALKRAESSIQQFLNMKKKEVEDADVYADKEDEFNIQFTDSPKERYMKDIKDTVKKNRKMIQQDIKLLNTSIPALSEDIKAGFSDLTKDIDYIKTYMETLDKRLTQLTEWASASTIGNAKKDVSIEGKLDDIISMINGTKDEITNEIMQEQTLLDHQLNGLRDILNADKKKSSAPKGQKNRSESESE